VFKSELLDEGRVFVDFRFEPELKEVDGPEVKALRKADADGELKSESLKS
jgi:hypothetical protein